MAEDIVARYVLDLKDLTGKVSELEKQFGRVDAAADKSASSVGGAFSKASGSAVASLAKLGGAITAAFTVKEIVAFGKESVLAFQAAEKSATLLMASLRSNGGIQADFDKLIEQSEALQKKTIFTSEQIQSVQRAGAQFGLSASAIEKLIPVVADFASGSGLELSSAFDVIISATNGSEKALKQYGIQIDTTATKSDRFKDIQEKLSEAYKGQAEILAGTTSGSMQRLSNAYDSVKESIGRALLPIAEFAASVGKSFVDMASTPLSEKLKDEQEAFAVARIELLSLNVGSKQRVKIIDELKQKYPDYLGLINSETVSNDVLFKSLDKINNSLIFRIAVQKTEEAMAAQGEITGKALNDQIKAKNALLIEYNKVLGDVNSAERKKREEQVAGLPPELAIKEIINSKIKLYAVSSSSIINLADAYDFYQKSLLNSSKEQVKFNDLQFEVKKRQEDIKELLGAPPPPVNKTGIESILDGINLSIVSMKKLLSLRDELLKKKDETSKAQLDDVNKEIERRVSASKKANEERIANEKKTEDLIQGLKEKELKADLENILIQLAADKEAIENSKLSEFGKIVAVKEIELKALRDRALAYTQYGKDVGSTMNQIVDKTKELSDVNAKGPGPILPGREQFEDQQKAISDADAEILKRKEENNKAIKESAISSAQSIADSIFEINRNLYDSQIADIQRVRDAEQEALDASLEANQKQFEDRIIGAKQFRDTEMALQKQKEVSDDNARKKENEIKRKQAALDKAQRLFQVAMATATGIMNVWATFGGYPPVAAALTAIIAAVGIAQTAAILSAPVPKYYKGTRYVDEEGRHPNGVDTVNAMLTRGERVIPVEDNRKNWHLYEAIRTKNFDKYINKVYVVPALNKAIDSGKIREQKTFAENVAYTLMMNEDSLSEKIALAIVKEQDWRGRHGQKIIGMPDLINAVRESNRQSLRKN